MPDAKHADQEFRSSPAPRIPRVPEYQRRAQLPWTLFALIIIATAGTVGWLMSL